MANPVEGSDYTVQIESPETLVGATVTIEYRTPNNVVTEDIVPTDIDTEDDVITYEIDKSKTINGIWRFWAKIINAAGKTSYVNPPGVVKFDRRGV